jgi:DNA-binding transcriptional MocR family regulator
MRKHAGKRMAHWIRREDLSDGIAYLKIADAMTSAIRLGTLAIGTRLPTQRELAAELAVNVGTVSRAYTSLQNQGLIEARPRLGTFVRARAAHSQRTGDQRSASTLVNLGTNTRIPSAFASAFGPTLADLGAHEDVIHKIEGYKPVGGLLEHRAAVARWLSASGGAFEPEQVLITDSASTAALVVLMALAQPGDLVLTESLTFPGLKLATSELGLRLVGVDMDAEGMNPEALERACMKEKPRLIVCTPTLQNPTCSIMGEQRRRDIADIARRHGVVVVEDAVYHMMVPSAQRPGYLAAYLPDLTIMISSVSKTIAQVFRIGLIVASESLARRLLGPLQAVAFTGPNLMAEILARWIDDGTADRVIDAHRAEIALRHAAARPLLGEFEFVTHEFSSHSWLTVPRSVSASEFFSNALHAGIGLRLADEFAVDTDLRGDGVRITLGAARSVEELTRALGVLRQLLDGVAIRHRLLA